MNKKGFTLIELLAVIVILGIIMLIAVPSVSNIIENSKRKSYEISAKTYLKELEQYPLMHKLNKDNYKTDLNNQKIDNVDILNSLVSAMGEKPMVGSSVTFNSDNKITQCTLVYPGYTFSCKKDDSNFNNLSVVPNYFDDNTGGNTEQNNQISSLPNDFLTTSYPFYTVIKYTTNTYSLLAYQYQTGYERIQSVCYDTANKRLQIWYDSYNRITKEWSVNSTFTAWNDVVSIDGYNKSVPGGNEFGTFAKYVDGIESILYSTIKILDCNNSSSEYHPVDTGLFDYIFN